MNKVPCWVGMASNCDVSNISSHISGSQSGCNYIIAEVFLQKHADHLMWHSCINLDRHLVPTLVLGIFEALVVRANLLEASYHFCSDTSYHNLSGVHLIYPVYWHHVTGLPDIKIIKVHYNHLWLPVPSLPAELWATTPSCHLETMSLSQSHQCWHFFISHSWFLCSLPVFLAHCGCCNVFSRHHEKAWV